MELFVVALVCILVVEPMSGSEKILGRAIHDTTDLWWASVEHEESEVVAY